MQSKLLRFSGSRIVVDTTHSATACCLDEVARSQYSSLGTRGSCTKCNNRFKVCRLDEVDEDVMKGVVGFPTDPNGSYALALLYFSKYNFPTSHDVATWLERNVNFCWDREQAVKSINESKDGYGFTV